MTPNAIPHPSAGYSHVRWILVLVMCVASFVSYVLRTNISIAGETLMKELNLSEVQLGMVFSAFAWGYAVFQFPGGIYGDLAGSRKAMTVCAVLWSVLTVLTGLAPDPAMASTGVILTTLIVLRFLTGAVHAPIFPIVGGTIGNWFPVSGWALPNGLTSTALTLGAAAAAPLMVWLVNLAGWRGSFLLTAPLGVIVAWIWWRHVRDYPVEHPSVSAGELALIDANRALPIAPEKGAWKLVLRNRNILLLTASYFCMNYIFYLFFNWFFIYLVDVRHVPQEEAGFLTASQWIVGGVGATLGGYHCDRFARRFGARWGYRLVPVPALILAAVVLLAGAVTKSSYAAVGLLALCSGLTQLTDSAYWAAVVSVAGRHASAASGVLNTGGNVVGGIGAVLVPVTARMFGWVAAIATGSLFALIAALLWLLIKADEPMATELEPAKISEP